ncbi:MAG TPA: dTDP-4-dehydrorhamnose 3,5-epimerase [Stellaceae bacterium]|jgi:dTDP-4-dehydrorhamnose 3,5-epimerase|nr:dTDP-4-dehydrorhamnose 3,5-epimerase [Stellaceae bacterium]
MQITDTALPGVKLIQPVRHGDARGYFSETYREEALAAAGIGAHFVQENQSLSAAIGVVRGLHFQLAPMAQAKLIRVIAGSILDVAVDIRKGSPHYGKHVAVALTAAEGNQLFVPEGFAHGFCTLEPDTLVIYKVNNYWSPEHERGLLWNDPALGIDWRLGGNEPTLSEKDKHYPALADLPHYFDHS